MSAVEQQGASIPEELLALPQWLVWKSEPDSHGRPTKVPYRATTPAVKAASTNPRTWSDYATAVATARVTEDVAGIGIVVTEHDSILGVDLDGCILDGHVHGAALALVKRIDSYTEVSPSGTGLRVFVMAAKPGSRCRTERTSWGGGVEMYDHARFFTVTGQHLPSTPTTVEERQGELDALYEELFPPEPESTGPPATTRVVSIDDHELIERARGAANGGKFAALWDGDLSGHADDHSSADLALCNHLAFWTGGDAARIDHLFQQSGLMRPKWDERRGDSSYGAQTIAKALAGSVQTYKEINDVSNVYSLALNGSGHDPGLLVTRASVRSAYSAPPREPWRPPATASSCRPPASSMLSREVTERLDLTSDPVVEVKRWGRHEDSRLVITLRSQRRIVFDRARDAFEPVVLKRRVVLATDGQASPATFKKPEAEDVAVKLIRLANVAADADDRDEARDWTGRFLATHANQITDVADFSTPQGRYGHEGLVLDCVHDGVA